MAIETGAVERGARRNPPGGSVPPTLASRETPMVDPSHHDRRQPADERRLLASADAATRARTPARRPRSRAARGGARDERAGRDPRRRRDRQDAGDQPADGVRDRDRRRAAGPGARRHVHRQGRGRDGRAAARARAAGRHGADVPRPRAQPAAPLLAVAPRRRAAPRAARLQDPDPRPARAPAARPLPVHAGEGPRRRDRVGEVAPDRAARVRARGRPRRAGPRAADPGRPVRAHLRRATSAPRPAQGRIDFDDLLVETVDLLEDDADAAETVRARKRWFSVDEYQDTNPLQQRLLELWLGDRHGPLRRRRRGPDDLHVHRRHVATT